LRASGARKTNCELQVERNGSINFLEARKGVRADFSVRPSGTAASAARSLPFDSGLEQDRKRSALGRPELVGFLLHPISRSETRRRLIQLHANFDQTPLARSE